MSPLVAASGLEKVTTKALAAAAGVSEALLYKHFPSKEELNAAIEQDCVLHATADAQHFASLPDSTETLVMMVWLLMNNICEGSPREQEMLGQNRHLTRLMMRSLLDDGEFARNFLEGAAAQWLVKVRSCATAAERAGDLVESSTHAALGVWFAHHISVALVMFSLPSVGAITYDVLENGEERSLDRKEVTEYATRFALRGLGLTESAFERWYRPQSFKFLLDAGRED